MSAISVIILMVVICFLLATSAFFSGSETALTAASEARMRTLAKKGNENASAFERLRRQRDILLSTLLIGNNLVNTLATSLATGVMITLFGDKGIALATVLMTAVIVLFSEVLPKTYAFNHATGLALRISRPVGILVMLLRPLSLSLHWIVRIVASRLPSDHGSREEELRGMIDIHTSSAGKEIKEQGAMLSSVLDLGMIVVDEVMTHRASVSMISDDMDAEAVLRHVMESPFTRHPVYSGKSDNIIGVLHVKALLRAMGNATSIEALEQINIIDIAAEAYFVPETTLLIDQLQAFRNRREHFAVVVDEYGDFRGIVTLEDILEEIVGDIDDEHDIDLVGLRPQNDGSWVADGQVTIRDLNRELGCSLPDNAASTLAGLILHEARAIPVTGQEFYFHNMRFRILRSNRNRIEKIQFWHEIGKDEEIENGT